MAHLDHPYASFIDRVTKPARYLGGEYQSVVKDWSQIDATICLAFPDLYDIGMSHLGTKILYSVLNADPGIACERAFAPWKDMEAELRARELPVLSLESARPLRDFDVVGFSLQYELTYTNVLNLLDLSGIPLRSADRSEADPIIVAGGPTATHPEPMGPFLDAILVGDGEEAVPEATRALAQWKRDGLSRLQRLERLAALGGWYVPALYSRTTEPRNDLRVIDADASRGPIPVVRRHLDDIDRYPFPSDSPVAAAEAIFDRMSIEIARGCTEGCRFCQAGMIYRPVRERDPDTVVDTVLAAMDKGGYDEVSLTSLSTADYSCISPLIKKVMDRLRARKGSLSVSSLRAYGLDEDLLDEISSVKATGLTFAPEAGTQRMRDVVNKNITEEDIMTTADRVFSRGWSKMKFYFMIGLPTETDEDVAGIVTTASKARKIGLRYHRRVQVTASASSHIPKPHTPFQWAAMDSLEEIRRKQRILRDLGRRHKVPVRYHNQRGSWIEGIMARGDDRVADVIEGAFQRGARMDSWDDELAWDAWLEAVEESGIDPQRYLGTLPTDGRLPWDHIDVGLADKFLYKEYKRALKDRLSPPCGKPKGMQVHHTNVADAQTDQRKLICYHCGVACDLGGMRDERIQFLTQLGADLPPNEEERAARGFVPAYQQIRKNKYGHDLPPRRPSQGDTQTYRLFFTKLGHAAMTSQLDIGRILPRVVRRAGVRMKYSQGFSPKPVMSFGPALTLGVSSLCEAVDIEIIEDLAPTELLARLNAVSDEGFNFLQAARLPERARTLGKTAKLAEYVVSIPGADAESLTAGATRLTGDVPLLRTVKRNKGDREIDVRDGVVEVAVSTWTPAEAAALKLTGDAAERPVLRWVVDVNHGAHVRPGELAATVFGDAACEAAGFLAARTRIGGRHKDVDFDLLAPPLSTLRPVAAKKAPCDRTETADIGAAEQTSHTGAEAVA